MQDMSASGRHYTMRQLYLSSLITAGTYVLIFTSNAFYQPYIGDFPSQYHGSTGAIIF
jgi:hypothetical protein